MQPVGRQSAFMGGLAAACAGMHAALLGNGAVVDVSIQEALATLAMTELARAGQTGRSWSRKRVGDGNGATVCILPAADGYAAISPREDRQWAAWLEAMGSPDWGREARFARESRPRGQLGRAARPDVGLEPGQDQGLDRADRPGCPRAKFPVVRAGGASRFAATPASRLLPHGLDRRTDGADARTAVRAAHNAKPTDSRARRAAAAVGGPGAGFQLGDRGANGDPVSGGDGGRGHQDRSPRAGRSGARIGTAQRAGAGEEGRRAGPEEARGDRRREGTRRLVRCAGGEFRHRCDGPAWPWAPKRFAPSTRT